MTNLEETSPFFHSKDKGCKLEDKYIKGDQRKRNLSFSSIKAQFCITHQKGCCRCGWEFTHHQEKQPCQIKKKSH